MKRQARPPAAEIRFEIEKHREKRNVLSLSSKRPGTAPPGLSSYCRCTGRPVKFRLARPRVSIRPPPPPPRHACIVLCSYIFIRICACVYKPHPVMDSLLPRPWSSSTSPLLLLRACLRLNIFFSLFFNNNFIVSPRMAAVANAGRTDNKRLPCTQQTRAGSTRTGEGRRGEGGKARQGDPDRPPAVISPAKWPGGPSRISTVSSR